MEEKTPQEITKEQEVVWDNIAPEWHDFKKIPSGGSKLFLEEASGKVLDLGSGSGRHMPEKLDGKYYMLDLSREMLKLAEEKAKEKPFDIETIHSSMDKIPIEDNFFDYAISISALHCIPGEDMRKKSISELFRVMKPESKAYIGVWNRASKRFIRKTRKGKIEHMIGWQDKGKRYYYLYSEEEVHNQFKEAGFKIISNHNSEMMINFIVQK